jgi:DNA invertase Pin-like site-specific DNA recombinase
MRHRAGIYLRLSRDDGRNGEANSIAGQRRDCLAYCEARDWDVVEFTDEGISASKGLDRPAYSRLLDAMTAGDLVAIVAAKQDRFTRDSDAEWGQLKRLAREAGVEIHTADSGPLRLDTADGELSADIRAVFGAFEARVIQARTRRGLQTRREAGEWASHGQTYGYLPGGIVNEEQAAHVRWAYDQILNQGRNVRHVFETWRHDGVLTVRGNQWSSVDNVARTLRNPVLAGLVVHKGEILGPGNWAPIVSPEERQQMMAAIEANIVGARGYNRRAPRERQLAGLVLCGNPDCDLRPMKAHNPGNGRPYSFYCDPRRYGCGNRVPGGVVEEIAIKVAVQILLHTQEPETTLPEFDDTRLRAIEDQIAQVRQAVAKLDLRASDAVPILDELRQALEEQHAAKDAHDNARALKSWHHRELEAVMDGDREAIAAVIDNVRVLPERRGYVVEARKGLDLIGVKSTWLVDADGKLDLESVLVVPDEPIVSKPHGIPIDPEMAAMVQYLAVADRALGRVDDPEVPD